MGPCVSLDSPRNGCQDGIKHAGILLGETCVGENGKEGKGSGEPSDHEPVRSSEKEKKREGGWSGHLLDLRVVAESSGQSRPSRESPVSPWHGPALVCWHTAWRLGAACLTTP